VIRRQYATDGECRDHKYDNDHERGHNCYDAAGGPPLQAPNHASNVKCIVTRAIDARSRIHRAGVEKRSLDAAVSHLY